MYFARSTMAAGEVSAAFTLPNGSYQLCVKRDPTAAGGINENTVTTVREVEADGTTQTVRTSIDNHALINGVGYALFQSGGNALTILAGERGIAWVGVSDVGDAF